MKIFKRTILALCLVLLFSGAGRSWENYDRIIAIVNSISIIESEVNTKLKYKLKGKKVAAGRLDYEKSRVLDRFIEDALVYEAAMEEAIVISDSRVLEYVERMMKDYFLSKGPRNIKVDELVPKLSARLDKKIKGKKLDEDADLDMHLNKFISSVESTQKILFEDFFEEIRTQMRREQVMSIAIGVTPPSKEEAIKWFKQNKVKLGHEVYIKHILIRPAGSSLAKEKETESKLMEIRRRIIAGESFEKMAGQYSQDASAKQGGDLGWSLLVELDPYLANHVFRMSRKGEISEVFRSGAGYHIVKLVDRRDVTFEKMERLITFKLYNEKMLAQFQKWVQKRKNESEIQIFMKNYKKSEERQARGKA